MISVKAFFGASGHALRELSQFNTGIVHSSRTALACLAGPNCCAPSGFGDSLVPAMPLSDGILAGR